jgi:DNA-damage-inducible protein J
MYRAKFCPFLILSAAESGIWIIADMSGAVNIFLRQCILRGGLPFKVEVPRYSNELLSAADEAKRISRDPDVPGYTSMEDLKKALEA